MRDTMTARTGPGGSGAPDHHKVVVRHDAAGLQDLAVVVVLHDGAEIAPVEQQAEGDGHHDLQDPCPEALRGKHEAETGDGIDHAPDAGEACRQRSQQYRLERHMMDDVGPEPAVGAPDAPDRRAKAERVEAAPRPRQGIESQARLLDFLAVAVDAAGDRDLHAPGGERQRQPQAVGAEVPVLGDEEHDADGSRRHGSHLARQAWNISTVHNW
jgi:hypothetical protein